MRALSRFINATTLTKAALAVATLGVSLASVAADDQPADNYSIDISQLSTTKEEVAVLQVMSEICPPMLNKQQQQSFLKAYNQELQNLMPSISEPRLAIQYLSSQQDYKKILNETRQWTLGYPKDENKAVCLELANSQ